MTFLAGINSFVLLILLFSCVIRLNALKGAERPIESTALIMFSFACLGQVTHYIDDPQQLDVIDVIFNTSLMILGAVVTERAWRQYFFNRRRAQVAHLEVDRRVPE